MAKVKESEKQEKEKKTPERAKVEDVTPIVIDLGKKGNTPSQIGMILRDKYGVQKAKLLGKKVTKILRENNIEYKDDLKFVEDKLKKIETHIGQNKQDKKAKREVVKYVSLKKRLIVYNQK